MARKKKFAEGDLDVADLHFYIGKLASLETCDRGIKREQEDKAEAVKEWNGRIAELEKQRNQLLDDLDKFRLGHRDLPLSGDISEPDADGVVK